MNYPSCANNVRVNSETDFVFVVVGRRWALNSRGDFPQVQVTEP